MKKNTKLGATVEYKVPAISDVCPATKDKGKLIRKGRTTCTVEELAVRPAMKKKDRYFIPTIDIL